MTSDARAASRRHPLPPAEQGKARALGALLCLLLHAAANSAQALPPVAELARLQAWLTGEWNNNEQVWQRTIDIDAAAAAAAAVAASQPARARAAQPAPAAPAALAVQHMHWRAQPLTVMAANLVESATVANGPPMLLAQVARGDDPTVVRSRWLWQLTPVATAAGADATATPLPLRLQAWRLDAADVSSGSVPSADTLQAAQRGPACTWLLRYDAAAQAWAGSTEPGRCASDFGSGTPLHAGTALRVSATQLQLSPAAADAAVSAPLRARRVRHFDGWVWFRNAGPGAAGADKATSFTPELALHSEGRRAVLLGQDGNASPWALELAVLTYQNTRRAILKLALVDRASGKSVAYTWANPDATTLGINLGWFQAGMTERGSVAP